MSGIIEFEAKIAKHRRINIPKSLYRIKDGDKVKVKVEKIEEEVVS